MAMTNTIYEGARKFTLEERIAELERALNALTGKPQAISQERIDALSKHWDAPIKLPS